MRMTRVEARVIRRRRKTKEERGDILSTVEIIDMMIKD